MVREVFHPKIAVRERKRQANEALGRSFCKTIAEPVTNSDSSAKRKLKIPHSSGLIQMMLGVQKGTQMDTAALKTQLLGKHPKRRIVIEVVTSKSSGRPAGEIVVVDEAEGMSSTAMHQALEEIGGDKLHLSAGVVGRNLFGRGLSDVLSAHTHPLVQSYDGKQFSQAVGEWDKKHGWTIELDYEDAPTPAKLKQTMLSPGTTGTAVRFVISDAARAQGCRIPDHPQILYRLENFYMLRLIASDPNVELVLRQRRTQKTIEDRLQFDFPVGQVIDSHSAVFEPSKHGAEGKALNLEFVVVRSSGARAMASGFPDRDARERGLLIVDELDAVYDLTFADSDYEKADFLEQIYGVIRVNGLRQILQSFLDAEHPTSPLRPDREGFNRDHEFSRGLLEFIADQLRPLYEKERKRAEEKEEGNLSTETKRRMEDALKQLNKYFQQITELDGEGDGADGDDIEEPKDMVSFFPPRTRLIAGRPKQVLLLVREDAIHSGAEALATASEGLTVQPERELISSKDCPRWSVHKNFFALPFAVSATAIGTQGQITAIVEGKEVGSTLEAVLHVEDVLAEPVIDLPDTLEFRPTIANGRPGRRNNLVLYVNPDAISPGHYVRVRLVKRTGGVRLLAPNNAQSEQFDVKLDGNVHGVKGQKVLRVLIPWIGTAWNQHGNVEASVKVGNETLMATATIRLDEPEDGGFFKDIKYDEIDPKAPSQLAAGIITVNIKDPLNRVVFGDTKEDFDKRVSTKIEAQQRLASLLLEEASFRALEQLYKDNKVNFADRREIGEVHEKIDAYKFESAGDVYKALSRSRS
jgi:hypothetical protein